MPRIPQELLQEILQRTDIVQLIGEQVALRASGRNYLGLCPFHQEKTPSFQVDPTRQFFYCFGCQTGGDAIRYLQLRDSLSFMEAVEYLAERAGVSLPQDESSYADDSQLRLKRRLYDACQAALQFFQQQLKTHPEAAKARRYIIRRQIEEETVRQFQMGYAPPSWRALAEHLQVNGFGLDILEAAGLVVRQSEQNYYDRFRDRLIFPIFDFRGRCIGFGGRQLVDDPKQPKYLNSPQSPIFDKSHSLYGIHLHKGKRSEGLVVYEGYMDLISTWQAGCKNGVASLGTALTQEHCRLIKRFTDRVTLCYDADNAGQAATRRGMFLLKEAGLDVQVARVPDGKDPDDFVRLHGGELFQSDVLNKALPLLRYCKDMLKGDFDLEAIEGKSNYVREFLTILSKIASPIEEEEYMREVASDLRLTYEAIQRQYQQVQRAQQRQQRPAAGARARPAGLIGSGSGRGEGNMSENVERNSSALQVPQTDNGESAGDDVNPGRLRAEEILLSIACADPLKASRLIEQVQPQSFRGALYRGLAEKLWDSFRARIRVFDLPGLEPESASLLSKFSFLEASFTEGREQAFEESLTYLQADNLRLELAELSRRCEELQQSGDDAALLAALQRMQEIQQELAARRSR